MPRRYTTHYLLPILSGVLTCSHAELLAFPASDVINYKKLSHGQQHYTVCGGVHQVQARLAKEMKDVRLGACVAEVAPSTNGRVIVRWQSTSNPAGPVMSETFDRVVLAVSPDVARKVFSPLREILEPVPTLRVESSVLRPAGALESNVPQNRLRWPDGADRSITYDARRGNCEHLPIESTSRREESAEDGEIHENPEDDNEQSNNSENNGEEGL
ncbi:hypothetical protein CSPX01_00618 [Colletotrichum filicis]|nr:hypothetical protein CSPX01_00618 [Colletotrichum filicis]